MVWFGVTAVRLVDAGRRVAAATRADTARANAARADTARANAACANAARPVAAWLRRRGYLRHSVMSRAKTWRTRGTGR